MPCSAVERNASTAPGLDGPIARWPSADCTQVGEFTLDSLDSRQSDTHT